MEKYNVKGELLTKKQWENIVCKEMNEICEYQEYSDVGTDAKGKEYCIQWKPVICEM